MEKICFAKYYLLNQCLKYTATKKQFYFSPHWQEWQYYCEINNCLVHMIVLCEAGHIYFYNLKQKYSAP